MSVSHMVHEGSIAAGEAGWDANDYEIAKAVLLGALDVNDDEAIEAIARAIAREQGWALTSEHAANPRAMTDIDNPRSRMFCRYAIAAIGALRALVETRPNQAVAPGHNGGGE